MRPWTLSQGFGILVHRVLAFPTSERVRDQLWQTLSLGLTADVDIVDLQRSSLGLHPGCCLRERRYSEDGDLRSILACEVGDEDFDLLLQGGTLNPLLLEEHGP